LVLPEKNFSIRIGVLLNHISLPLFSELFMGLNKRDATARQEPIKKSSRISLFLTFSSKLACNLVLASLISLTFLVPALLFRIFQKADFVWFNLKYFWIFFAFGFILTSCKSKKTTSAVFLLVGTLEITQFCSLAYFGEFLSPYAIGQMFTEMVDVSKAVVGSFSHLSYVLFIVIIPYGLMLLLLRAFWRYELKIRFASVLVALFLIFPAIRINLHADRNNIVSFFPVLTTPTLGNTLNSYSIWLTRLLPQSLFPGKRPSFKPVHIEKMAIPEKITVVLIMGESQTCRRMSLFGFSRETTPGLDKLKNDPNFVFKKGYSAAVATRATLPMFYNIQYNPLDQDTFKFQPTNMFHLAKEAGFQTIYISAQNANCLNGVNTHAIDHFISYDTDEKIFDRLHDDALLHLLTTFSLKDRNFIVLHQRNAHAPYETNYVNHKELIKFPYRGLPYHDYIKNSYDNAVLYNDYLYCTIIDYFKTKVAGPVYLFITSDHGEEFGEQGLWGHDHLTYGSSMVPILFYNINGSPDFLARFRALQRPTHYELELQIADRLGYRIDDPNRDKDWFYVDGVAALGLSGYMKFRKSHNDKPAEAHIF
jgi:glucan phosphoethanolaminetransferase (alkaline phosphatase superfamily)